MRTEADRWVEAQLGRVEAHPAWPCGLRIAAFGPMAGGDFTARLRDWTLYVVGQPLLATPAGGPWIHMIGLRWIVPPPVARPPDEVVARIWALRLEAPSPPFWWELCWRPDSGPSDLTPYGAGRVTVDRARAYFASGLDWLRDVGEGVVHVDVFLERLERDMRAVYAAQYRGRRPGPYRSLALADVADQHGFSRAHLHEVITRRYGLRWSTQLKPWTPDCGLTLTAFARREQRRAERDDPTHADSLEAETDA